MQVKSSVCFVITVALFLVATSVGLAQVEDLSSERPPGESPTRVEVAFYLIDLMRVIDRDGTFEADVFVIANWKDPRLSGERVRVVPATEVWTPNVAVFNERAVSSRLPEVVEIQPDGTVVSRQRLIGTFSSALDLGGFPLDRQTLELRLVVYGNNVDEVLLVESSTMPSGRSPELAVTDWEIGELETNAAAFSPIPGFELSSLTLRLPARRLVGYYAVQILVPLILIVSMSWIPFWIGSNTINVRVGVCVTTVLTLIAYRFMIGGLVPKLPYLTRIDHLLLGSTILVASALVCAVGGAFLMTRDRAASVRRLDAVARVAFPVGFVLLLGWVMLVGS
ncbi:MAG: hypothetical protein OEV00_02685 [Acidobacteriota bacterium]|nr:hypothetical protein [Acidobacteriota bacterium]MDH3784216.1 hypothetical protein [Acidobacteriota bacterium]